MKTSNKTLAWLGRHKIISLLVLLGVVGLGYFERAKLFGTTPEVSYAFATVERGNIVASVSGSGQVTASDQVELTAKVSGDLVAVNAKVDQEVGAGAIVARLDSSNAVNDLETAQLSLDKLVAIDPNDLRDAEDAATAAEENLDSAYTGALSTLTGASTALADVLTGTNDLFGGYLSTSSNTSISQIAKDYINRAKTNYYEASRLLKDLLKQYRPITTAASQEEIDSLTKEFSRTALAVAQTAKYAQDAVVYLRDRESNNQQTTADDAYASVTNLLTQANTQVTNLSETQDSLLSNQRALEKAARDLEDLRNGPDDLDLRTSQLAVDSKRNALADYTVRAPFAGIIAAVNVGKGDAVNSGTVIATLITKKKVAEISLNEIDAAKIHVGQKVTLTFDAVENLTITGKVTEMDLVGTVSQGVVNYTVKIEFDTDDARIKPGMTVNASIITGTKQNVLVIPLSAVKTQAGISYVEVMDAGATVGTPRRVEVKTGFANDDSVEIVSGLQEGDRYVARTINNTAPTAAAPSLFGGGGRLGGSSGGTRAFVR